MRSVPLYRFVTVWGQITLQTIVIATLDVGMAGCEVLYHSAAKVEGMGPLQPFLDTNVEGGPNFVHPPWTAAMYGPSAHRPST